MSRTFHHAALLLILSVVVGSQIRSAGASLLVDYSFDEASSGNTTAINSGTLGATANGTFTGAATRTSNTPGGVSLGALNLNPNGSAPLEGVTPGSNFPALNSSTLTVSTWVDVQGTAPGGTSYLSLFGQPSNGGVNGWLFFYTPVAGNQANMDLSLQINHGPGTTAAATAPVSASNTWVFVAATWNQSTGDVKFYSGTPSSPVTQVGTTITGFTTALVNTTAPFAVGNDGANSTPDAFLDNVRIYDTVLTISQLNDLRLADSTVVPEPSSMLLLACGACALFYRVGRKLRNR